MATIDTALVKRLEDYAGLDALISKRIYSAPIPQNAIYPLLTYQEISRVPIHVMGGTAGIVHVRYQLDSWAQGNYGLETAKAVAAQVEAALDNYAGTSDTIVILNCFLESGISMEYSDAEGVHRYMQEFVIEYRR